VSKFNGVCRQRWFLGLGGRAAIATLPLLMAIAPAKAENLAPNAPNLAPSPPKLSYVMPKETVLRLTLSPRFTATGERILTLALVRNGQVLHTLQAVSGKADVQYFRTGQQSRSGSREPLPQGVYRVGSVDRSGGLPAAMGDTFIPLTPLFATNRNGIGIHHDADRAIGGAGTIGCLGLLEKRSVQTVAQFVSQYQVKKLIVDYGL